MREFNNTLHKNSQSNYRLKSFADYDDTLIINESLNKIIYIHMLLGNVILTITLIIAMINDYKIISTLIILGISLLNLAIKTLLNLIIQHDTILITSAKLREEYLKEKESKDKNKESTKLSKLSKQLDAFKDEIHKTALER